MLDAILCKNCWKETIPLNSISVNVELSKNSWCEYCREHKTERQNYYFCSILCFNDWIQNNQIEWEK